jgi:hypothetical protein
MPAPRGSALVVGRHPSQPATEPIPFGVMGVSCKRVGCRVPASTSLVIDARTATVTLVEVETAPIGVTLCAVHVTAVTAPVGWTLVDTRDANLRLLTVEQQAAPATPRPSPTPAPVQATPAGQLAGDPFPWIHHFSEDDEPATLNATSPLLSRAFRAAV